MSNCAGAYSSGYSKLKISVGSTLLLFQLSFSYENKLKFVNFDVVIILPLARLTPPMTSEFEEHGYPISSLIMSKNVFLKVKVRDSFFLFKFESHVVLQPSPTQELQKIIFSPSTRNCPGSPYSMENV